MLHSSLLSLTPGWQLRERTLELWPEVGKHTGTEGPSGRLSSGLVWAPSGTSDACWVRAVGASPDADTFKQLGLFFIPSPQPHPYPSQQMDNREQPKLLNFSLIFPSLAN